jgi:hypothetical protein
MAAVGTGDKAAVGIRNELQHVQWGQSMSKAYHMLTGLEQWI